MPLVQWKQFKAIKCFGDGYAAIQLLSGGWMGRVAIKQLHDGERLLEQYLKATRGKLEVVVPMEQVDAASGSQGQ